MGLLIRLFSLLIISALLCYSCERDDDGKFPEIPDDHFWVMLILQGVDTNKDRKISRDEAEAVDKLILSQGYYYYEGDYIELVVSDLTGIEAFINLEYLDCSFQQLVELDISNNKKLKHLK